MNHEKIQVTIEVFFEIKDSEMFGGVGSVGYSSSRITGGYLMLDNNFEQYTSEQIKRFADLMNVSENCIRVITAEEYEMNTLDEE